MEHNIKNWIGQAVALKHGNDFVFGNLAANSEQTVFGFNGNQFTEADVEKIEVIEAEIVRNEGGAFSKNMIRAVIYLK